MVAVWRKNDMHSKSHAQTGAYGSPTVGGLRRPEISNRHNTRIHTHASGQGYRE